LVGETPRPCQRPIKDLSKTHQRPVKDPSKTHQRPVKDMLKTPTPENQEFFTILKNNNPKYNIKIGASIFILGYKRS